jgi:hypothetical protein
MFGIRGLVAMVEYLELTIDDLILDEDNPRLGSVGSQSEALEELIRLNPNHFRNLMLSIKENGLDPGDSLYVIEADDGDYTVLEGNRRLSALQVLQYPDKLDGTNVIASTKKSLLRASAGFKREEIEPIRCVLFAKREDANDWIYRRHTGIAEGEGRITWGSLEIKRFSGDHSLLDIIDFVGRNADFSEEEWISTKDMIESRKSTNLARLLDSAAGQDHLGITFERKNNERIPFLKSEPKWAVEVLKKVIEDVRDGVIDSRGLNRATDIEKYFKGLPKPLQPKNNKNTTSIPIKTINLKVQKTGTVSGGATKKPKTKATPRPRKTLAPTRHMHKLPKATKGQRLLTEAAMLDADRFTISAAFVLRAFIELAISEYMTANSIPTMEADPKGKMVELDLSQRADRVVKHIIAGNPKTSSDLRGFKNQIINKSAPSSIQSLNGFVHNQFQIPTPEAVRAGWESAIPVFIAAFGAV